MSSILAFIPDLMDRSRLKNIQNIIFVSTSKDLELAKTGDIVVVDLSRPLVLDTVAKMKQKSDPPRIIGFGSHVDKEILADAHRIGCDQVLARSAFFARSVELLKTV